MKDQIEREVETPPERTEPADETQQPPEEDESLAVEMFELDPREPYESETGIVVRQVSQAPPRVEFQRDGQAQTVELPAKTQYAEGAVFGNFFALSRTEQGFQVTLRSDVPVQPLSESEALTLARREMQSRLGCEGEPREVVTDHGTVVLEVVKGKEVTCRIVVGRYSRRAVDL